MIYGHGNKTGCLPIVQNNNNVFEVLFCSGCNKTFLWIILLRKLKNKSFETNFIRWKQSKQEEYVMDIEKDITLIRGTLLWNHDKIIYIFAEI